jgi:hypothetical protein
MLLALIEDCIRFDASANLCKTVTDSTPFDAMLLALIEDCIRSDASANLCKTVTDSLGTALCLLGFLRHVQHHPLLLILL